MSTAAARGPAPARQVDGTAAFAGRLIVLERLGIDTYGLEDRHPEPGELRSLARALARHAQRVDDADEELRRAADLVIRRVTRSLNGDHRDVESWGLLRNLGNDIETRAARYHLAVEQLGMAVFLYRQAAERPDTTADNARREAALSRTGAAAPAVFHPPARLPASDPPAPTTGAVRH
ncbi:hypothetical protein [Kitasatospora purpeofusca]|uniref:hypothetical protein n=1 Tax=Kitasatospora purpeofusca TaxID=67352 RepID=UPI00224DF984|nr:hypothetical protein [Kitasatospora purpeofusca]MCX4758758.1 hypothetical protein [Kitasatospora purpeofusca]WSR30811.1 hypothetical protein OG715_07405 [Kitasatospora purpeofusca]